jgi:hypothetical protein
MTEAAFTTPQDGASTGRDVLRSVPDRPDRRVRPAHWAAPDIAADLLAIARRAGAAEPVEIRVRPEVHRDMQLERPGDPLTDLDGIPLVVDVTLPVFPGYEVHRPWGSRAS